MRARWETSVAILVSALALHGCASDDDPADDGVSSDELRQTKLEVTRRASLPIAEASGLGRRVVAGKPQYLAIADATPALVTFDVTGDGAASKIVRHDLRGLFGGGDSQWEAVAGDGRGSVFLLAEADARVFVLDAGLARVTHTFQIEIPRRHPLRSAWDRDANSRGEGLVLLSNGHMLLVKEKDPVAILELAPEGEPAAGYRAELALQGGAFPVPRGATTTLVPVHHWTPKDSQEALLPDVSELAVDPEGRLLLLTDQGRAIARVEKELRPDEDRIDVKGLYRLPSSVDKPEGLVFASERPLVAVDARDPGESLFTLAPLP